MSFNNYTRGREFNDFDDSEFLDENTIIILGIIASLVVIVLIVYFLGYIPRTERYFLRLWKQFLSRNESSTGNSRKHVTDVVGDATACELRSNPCYILKYFGYLESDFKVHSGAYYKYDQIKFDLLVSKNKKQQHKSLDVLIPAYYYDKVDVGFSNTNYTKSNETKIKKAFAKYVDNYGIIFYSPTRTLVTRDEGIFSKEEKEYGMVIGVGLPVHVPYNSLTGLDKIALYENDFKIEEQENCDFYKKKVEKPKPTQTKCTSNSWDLGSQEVRSRTGCDTNYEIREDACDSLTTEQLSNPLILLSCPSIIKKDVTSNETFTDYVETFEETPPEEYDANSGIQLGRFDTAVEDPNSECDYYLPGIVRCIKIDNNKMLVEFKTDLEAPELIHGGQNSGVNSNVDSEKGLRNINVYLLKKDNFELTKLSTLLLDDGVDYRGKFSGEISLGQYVNQLNYAYLVEIEHIMREDNKVPVYNCYRYVWSSNDDVKYTPYLSENNVTQSIFDIDNDRIESTKNYSNGIVRNILYYNNNNPNFPYAGEEENDEEGEGHFKIWFKNDDEYSVLDNINGFSFLEVFLKNTKDDNKLFNIQFNRGDKDLRGYYYKLKNNNTPLDTDTAEQKANKNRFFTAMKNGEDIVFRISYVKMDEDTNAYTYKWKNNKSLHCGIDSTGDKCFNKNINLETPEYLSNKEKRENAEELWTKMSVILTEKPTKVNNIINLIDKDIKDKFLTAKRFFSITDNTVKQINDILIVKNKISKEALINKGLYLNFGDKVKLSNIEKCSTKLNRYIFFRVVMTWASNSNVIVSKTIKDCGLSEGNIDKDVIYKKLLDLYRGYYKRLNKKIPMDNSITQTDIQKLLTKDNVCSRNPLSCSGHYGQDGSNAALKEPEKKWNCDSCSCRDLDDLCVEEEDNSNEVDFIGNYVNQNCAEYLLQNYEIEECCSEPDCDSDQQMVSRKYFRDIIRIALKLSFNLHDLTIGGNKKCLSLEDREKIIWNLVFLTVNIIELFIKIEAGKGFPLPFTIRRGIFPLNDKFNKEIEKIGKCNVNTDLPCSYPLYIRLPKLMYLNSERDKPGWREKFYEFQDEESLKDVEFINIPILDYNNPLEIYYNTNNQDLKNYGLIEGLFKDLNLDDKVKNYTIPKRGGTKVNGTTTGTSKIPYGFYAAWWIGEVLSDSVIPENGPSLNGCSVGGDPSRKLTPLTDFIDNNVTVNVNVNQS